MPQENPFTITFGKAPQLLVPRSDQLAGVLESFRATEPSQQVYMITGPRGSGKTVFLTELANALSQDPTWIVADLNPERDLLTALAAKLNSRRDLQATFKKAQIDLSFLGLGVSLGDTDPITDIEVALSRMLESIRQRHRRVLITIDEAGSTPYMRAFAASFQMLLRQDLPVYLLMAGLYDNIDRLQNEKSLTFLYRAPKVDLRPLGLRTMAAAYQRVFGIEPSAGLSMARLTCGYSFAFQALGYLAWERKGLSDAVIAEYQQLLADLSYDKVWSELSAGDRRLAWGIAQAKTGKVIEVRAILGMETNQFNPYRRRLVRKGLVDGSQRGTVRFVLPFFAEYVLERYGEEELD